MAMQFGQFLDHDITLTPEGGQPHQIVKKHLVFNYPSLSYPELQCCDEDFKELDATAGSGKGRLGQDPDGPAERCFNIPVDTDDEEFDIIDDCYPFTRYFS